MGLEHIFSDENLRKYAGACFSLATDMAEVWEKKRFDTLLIPSRGAFPFFLGMIYALNKIGKEFGEPYNSFYKGLSIQKAFSSIIHDDLEVSHKVEESDIKTLLIPFTADLNFKRPTNKRFEDDYVTKTRRYWARVTSSFFSSLEERIKDPYFNSFINITLNEIEGRRRVSEMYRDFPKIERFAMIDTVISGRASNDILRSFSDLSESKENPNLVPYSFLIVDNNGEKLQSSYRLYLESIGAQNGMEFYKVPRIVSEDQGASLLGIASLVYPSVMRSSEDTEFNGEEFFVGAGSWRLSNDLGRDHSYIGHFNKFMKVIYEGIKSELNEENEFDKKREEFLDYKETHKIPPYGSDPLEMFDLNYNVEDLHETHSRVVHVYFNKKDTEKTLKKIVGLPRVIYKRKEVSS